MTRSALYVLISCLFIGGDVARGETPAVAWQPGDAIPYWFACRTPLDMELAARAADAGGMAPNVRCFLSIKVARAPVPLAAVLVRRVGRPLSVGGQSGAIWEIRDQFRDLEYIWLPDNRASSLRIAPGRAGVGA